MDLLSERIKVTQVVDATAGAAGTTDINGDAIDMSGFDGVLFAIVFGAITAAAVTSVKAQQGALANMSDAADLLGTGQTVADDDDEQVFIIDLWRPQERYVRCVVDRGTQNAVVQTALAIQYHAKDYPTALAVADAINVEAHVSPAEGTA